MTSFIATIVWNPDRIFFVVPYLRHPVTWYGVLFAFGFLIAYFLVKMLFSNQIKKRIDNQVEVSLLATVLTDRLAMLSIIATVLGARLGHVFFYDWPIYSQQPLSILKIWEGGLASHGAAVGMLVALVLFTLFHRRKYPFMTFLVTLDAVVVASAFVGGCIRIGNFMNQEILGLPTKLPWGVIFLRPMDGPAGIPLHPVQLYEAFFYFLVFVVLWLVWKQSKKSLGAGLLTGLFLVMVFTFRFLIEFVKLPLSQLLDERATFNMGQLLSIPFVLLGIYLLATCRRRKKAHL